MDYLADTVTIIRQFSKSGTIGKEARNILAGADKGKHRIYISGSVVNYTQSGFDLEFTVSVDLGIMGLAVTHYGEVNYAQNRIHSQRN